MQGIASTSISEKRKDVNISHYDYPEEKFFLFMLIFTGIDFNCTSLTGVYILLKFVKKKEKKVTETVNWNRL